MQRSMFSRPAFAAAVLFPALVASAQPSEPYAPSRFDNGPILQGTTAVLDAVTLRYDVNLGNPGPGVTFRTTEFLATAAQTGALSFLYDYRATHSSFQDRYTLTAFAEQADGSRQTVSLVSIVGDGPNSVVQAARVSLNVVAGRPYGIIVGGSNFDSISTLQGSVTLSQFQGVPGNRNVADWTSTFIAEGAAFVLPAVEFVYDVDFGTATGVFPFRTADFANFAIDSGNVNFNWSYSRDHAFFLARASLVFFSEGTTPVNQVELDNDPTAGPAITTDGSFIPGGYDLPVSNGGRFGVRVGGQNFDINSRIQGSVTISNFQPDPNSLADLTGDGQVDSGDLSLFIQLFLLGN